jgi:hypothetical protein
MIYERKDEMDNTKTVIPKDEAPQLCAEIQLQNQGKR